MATTKVLFLCLGQLVLGEDVTNARIIDATGRPSNAGLLQVKTEFGFGTVWCKRAGLSRLQGNRGRVRTAMGDCIVVA